MCVDGLIWSETQWLIVLMQIFIDRIFDPLTEFHFTAP